MSDETTETGLAGLTLNLPEQEPLAPVPSQSLVPVPAPTPMPEGWTIQRVSAFIRELAREVYELPIILSMHKVSKLQYDAMRDNEFFKTTLDAMRIEWHSATNTPKRVALESLILLEDALPTVAARLTKNTEPLPGIVELAKLLAKLGGIGENTQASTPGERFKIVINLGADTINVEKTRQILTVQPEPEGA